MNGTVPAPSPLVVGVAALAGLLLLLGGVAAFAASSRRRVRAEEEPQAEPRPGRPVARPAFAEDDLPGFRAAPPGTPTPVAPAHRPVVDRRRRRSRLLAAAAVGVLLLSGAVTVLVAGTRGPVAAGPSPAASASSPPLPAAEPVPGDVGARLTAAGLVLARVPVGVTAGFPRVSVSTSGDRALLHLELPTANCLLSEAPARPEDGGCQATTTEFADLRTPSLRVDRAGGRLTFSGRTPTYLRPDGAPPVWTGHSYDLTVTVDLPAPSGDAPLPTAGTVTIADQTAPTLPDPALTTVTYGS